MLLLYTFSLSSCQTPTPVHKPPLNPALPTAGSHRCLRPTLCFQHPFPPTRALCVASAVTTVLQAAQPGDTVEQVQPPEVLQAQLALATAMDKLPALRCALKCVKNLILSAIKWWSEERAVWEMREGRGGEGAHVGVNKGMRGWGGS